MMLSFHTTIHTALNTFLLIEVEGALSALCSPGDLHLVQKQIRRFCSDEIIFHEKKTALLLNAEQQLQQYFLGKRKEFELPINLYGSAFQQSVWKQLLTIPYGETRSYKEIAHALGQKGAQAVGTAVGKNPLPVIVPCHRVLPVSGTLGQFSMQGGPTAKAFLLNLENATYKQ